MRYFFVFLLVSIIGLISGCNSSNSSVNRLDTFVVAYNQQGQYLFNKAVAWTHVGRKFVSDSGLQATMGPIQQFKLRLPTTKADSVIDSTTHKLLRIKDSYPVDFLPDSLSKYIHIIDTLHTK
jgi:hypothetical protein